MTTRTRPLGCLALALISACSSDPPAPSEGTLGPSGGTLRAEGVTVTVPPGALSSETQLRLRCQDPVPQGYRANSSLCRFEPDGLRFAIPVSVTLATTGDTSRSSVWWSREASEGYDPLPTTFSTNAATALVTHFSTGFVGALALDDGGLDATADAAADALADATLDAATDAPTDAGRDVTLDETTDASDGGIDAATDATIDVRIDAATVDATADAASDVPTGVVAAPRPVYPRTGARALTNRPLVRWALPAGVGGARLVFCRDRALATGCVSTDVAADRGQPATGLAAGTWFWALRGLAGGSVGAAVSAVWRLDVPSSSGATQGFWGGEYDANGDGYADLMTIAFSRPSGSLDVYLGGPSGVTLASVVHLLPPVFTGSSVVFGYPSASGDFNGDGYGDLVVAADRDGVVYVLRGSAAGPVASYDQVTRGPAGFGRALLASDLDGDGRDDLVVDARAFFPGGPSGPSGAGVSLGLTDALAAGDLDGDGFNDLLGTHATLGPVWLAGSATGPRTASPTALGPFAMPAGDSNNDGFADVIVDGVLRYGGRAGVGAAGPSSPRVNVRPSPFAGGLDVADVDRDGDDDVFVSGVQLLRGDPSGRVDLRTALPDDGSNPASLAGDLNGDGFVDLKRVRGVRNGPIDVAHLGVSQTTLLAPADGPSPAVVNVGDMNGDGRADLVIGGFAMAPAVSFFANTPTGFAAPASIAVPPSAEATHVAAAGDLDRDGLADVAVSAGSGRMRVLFGSRTSPGARTLDLAATSGSGAVVPVAAGDLDGDRNLDLVMAPSSMSTVPLRLFRGTPTGPGTTGVAFTGTFAPGDRTLGGVYATAGVGDTNGDGFADLALDVTTNSRFGPQRELLLFNGSAAGPVFATSSGTPTPYSAQSTVGPLGDLNGDGRSEYAYNAAVVSGAGAALTVPDMPRLLLPAGDYNADGVGDVLAVFFSSVEVRAGARAGGSLGVVLQRWPIAVGGPYLARYPQPVAIVPDTDGDGRPDVVAQGLLLGTVSTPSPPWLTLP